MTIHVHSTAFTWYENYRRLTTEMCWHSLNFLKVWDFILTQEWTLPNWKRLWFPQIIHINLSSLDYLTKQVRFTVKSYRLAVGLLLLMSLKACNWAMFSSLNPYLLKISSECSPKTGLCVEETEARVWGENGTGMETITACWSTFFILQELRNTVKCQKRGHTCIQVCKDLTPFCLLLLNEYVCKECLQPWPFWWTQLLGKFYRTEPESFQKLLRDGGFDSPHGHELPFRGLIGFIARRTSVM